MRRQLRGQAAPAALVLVLLAMVLAAVVTDAVALLEMRQRGYRLAADAALQGTRGGMDYAAYVGGGEIWLDEALATITAEKAVDAALSAQGLTANAVLVRVLYKPTGGSIPGFPPHAAAQQGGGMTWEATTPSVGVYLELPVETLFLSILIGGETVVHVFAAASVAGL